jgi:hypothetical protein
MTPARRRLVALLTIGMEFAWVGAWATCLTAATLGRPFPLGAGAAALFGGYLLTRLHTGRGWLVLGVLAVQALGLLVAAGGVVHGLYHPGQSLLDMAWLAEAARAVRTPAEWMALVVSLGWPLLFWLCGGLLARRPVTYARVSGRFDVGLAGFFALGFVKFTAASHGTTLDDPVSARFLFPFVIASLLALGTLRLDTQGGKTFLPGLHGLAVFLSFAVGAVLAAGTLALFALPVLTAAADAGLVVLTRAGVAASPLLLWILRLLFAPQTLRSDPAPAPSGTAAPPPAAPPEPGSWMAAIQALLTWALMALLALAAAAAVGVAVYLLVRLLLARTARAPVDAQGRPSGAWLAWLRRLRGALAGLAPARRPAEFYRRLLGWARRSGLRRIASETPSEFGMRLAGAFPPLTVEIGRIVQAFNQEAYAEARVPAEQVAAARAAWRQLRSPRQWRARGHRWWRGG